MNHSQSNLEDDSRHSQPVDTSLPITAPPSVPSPNSGSAGQPGHAVTRTRVCLVVKDFETPSFNPGIDVLEVLRVARLGLCHYAYCSFDLYHLGLFHDDSLSPYRIGSLMAIILDTCRRTALGGKRDFYPDELAELDLFTFVSPDCPDGKPFTQELSSVFKLEEQ